MNTQTDRPVTSNSQLHGRFYKEFSAWITDPDRLRRIVVGFILIIAAFVRVIALDAVGFNSDEAVYAGQAAAIAQVPVYSDLFPVFRAHPLFFHVLLSFFYLFGVTEIAGRILSAVFGVAAVFVTYRLGKELYGEAAGVIAAILLALMPYHVIVTRQVLLDGPMTFFATLAVYMIARYVRTERKRDLFAAGIALGLTVLSKETGILLFGSVYAFFALSPEVRFRIREMVPAALISGGLILVYPLTVAFAGAGTTSTAQQYVIWQFFRFPNHTWDFYLRTLPYEIGPLILLLVLVGFVLLWRERSWRERLLVSWIIIPVVFFQFWPTKGFQYLLPTAPIFAVLAGRTLGRWFFSRMGTSDTPRRQLPDYLASIAIIIVAFSLLFPTYLSISGTSSSSGLAGSGGIPGGREAGAWISDNLPQGSTIMTIGPSMSNILQFYGFHRAVGLSVSANPLYRNPSYTPIDNPDLQIRKGEIQYIVWDAFSARRSSFFSEKLLGYVQKYNGRVVHVESIPLETVGGEIIDEPIIIIYRVYP